MGFDCLENVTIELDASNRLLMHSLTAAWLDLKQGLKKRVMWQALGLQDIKQRYRRSVLGPFWFTLSTAVMVGVLGFLYAELFHQSVADYLPYVAIGLVVWLFFSSLMNEACYVFIEGERLIKQTRLPLTLYVSRMVWRNCLIFFHNAVIILLLCWFLPNPLSWALLTIPFAVAVLAMNGVWMGVVLGVLCTRFRDLPPIVASIVQVGFFVTPIMWKAEILTNRAYFVQANPFYHYIHLIREPLLTGHVPLQSWFLVGSFTVLGYLVALFVLTNYRHRVAFWV